MKKNSILKKKPTLSRRAFIGGVGTAALGLPVAALAAQPSFKQSVAASPTTWQSGKVPAGHVRLLVKHPPAGMKISVKYVDSKQY